MCLYVCMCYSNFFPACLLCFLYGLLSPFVFVCLLSEEREKENMYGWDDGKNNLV